MVPPDPYFENCVFDQCGTGGAAVALCQAIQSYADLCAQAGVPINWRNNTFCRKCSRPTGPKNLPLTVSWSFKDSAFLVCTLQLGSHQWVLCLSFVPKMFMLKQLQLCVSPSPPIVSHASFFIFPLFWSFHFPHCNGLYNTTLLFWLLPAIKCPVGSHYEHCGSACPASCQDPGSESTCTEPCVEGCVCDPGFVLSGDECVPFRECGCTDKNNNYRPVSWSLRNWMELSVQFLNNYKNSIVTGHSAQFCLLLV